MIVKAAIVGGVLPALVMSTQTGALVPRQTCPAACSSCCDALPPAGCYAPVSGPGAGQYACYDYPPGEVVSTGYISASASAPYPASSQGHAPSYASSQPYGSGGGSYASSAPSYPSYPSSPEYSSSNGYGYAESSAAPHNGGSPTSYGAGPTPSTTTPMSGSSPSSSAAAPPGTNTGNDMSVAGWALQIVLGMLGLAVWA